MSGVREMWKSLLRLSFHDPTMDKADEGEAFLLLPYS